MLTHKPYFFLLVPFIATGFCLAIIGMAIFDILKFVDFCLGKNIVETGQVVRSGDGVTDFTLQIQTPMRQFALQSNAANFYSTKTGDLIRVFYCIGGISRRPHRPVITVA